MKISASLAFASSEVGYTVNGTSMLQDLEQTAQRAAHLIAVIDTLIDQTKIWSEASLLGLIELVNDVRQYVRIDTDERYSTQRLFDNNDDLRRQALVTLSNFALMMRKLQATDVLPATSAHWTTNWTECAASYESIAAPTAVR